MMTDTAAACVESEGLVEVSTVNPTRADSFEAVDAVDVCCR